MRRFKKRNRYNLQKYELKHHLLRLLLELDYYPELYDIIRVNRILYSYKYDGKQNYFMKKQKGEE